MKALISFYKANLSFKLHVARKESGPPAGRRDSALGADRVRAILPATKRPHAAFVCRVVD